MSIAQLKRSLGFWDVFFIAVGQIIGAGVIALTGIAIGMTGPGVVLAYLASAVLVIVVIQTAYLTPPMAPAIFYLRTVAPPEITYRDMYLGVVPFVFLEIIVLALVVLFPETATYLPKVMILILSKK